MVSEAKDLTDTEKSNIKQDLMLLAINLVTKTLPAEKFHFCSSVYCGIFNAPTIKIERDSLLANGENYIVIIKDFFKIIREAYKCLEILI